MRLMRILTATAAAVLILLAGAPASAAPRPVSRGVLSNGQLVQLHDCRPIGAKPTTPGRVRGFLRDDLATPRRDLIYVPRPVPAWFGRYRTTHYCYR